MVDLQTATSDATTGSRPAVDGRSARRERNIDAVLDVVLEMFAEGELFPTVDHVSKRSGVSVRSIYRYFADPAELTDAAIARHRQRSEALAHLSAIGQGPLPRRIDDFVTMRLRLHDELAAAYRATVHNAPRHPRLATQLARGRADLRDQFDRHFAPELAARPDGQRAAVAAAGDLLTQLDSIELLRHHHQLSPSQAAEVLRLGLSSILQGGTP